MASGLQALHQLGEVYGAGVSKPSQDARLPSVVAPPLPPYRLQVTSDLCATLLAYSSVCEVRGAVPTSAECGSGEMEKSDKPSGRDYI